MKIQPETNGFKITKWYASVTLKQEFSNKVSFETAHAIHCVPKLSHSKDSNRKIARLVLEWGYILKNFIEYIAEDIYYIHHTDCDNENEVINQLILISYVKFLSEFEKKKTGVDFNLLPPFDQSKVSDLRQKILKQIHK